MPDEDSSNIYTESPSDPSQHSGPSANASESMGPDSSAAEDLETAQEAQEPSSEGSGFWRAFYADKKLFYSTLGAVLFVLIGAGIILYFLFARETPPPPADLNITLETPSRIVAGQSFEMTVSYHNRSDRNLENVQLNLVYPLDYTFRESDPAPANPAGKLFDLGNLSAKQTKEVAVTGVMDGQVGDKKDIQISLTYNIEGFRASYRAEKKETLELGSPDLSMTMTGPTDATAGQVIVYSVAYKNVSDRILRNVQLSLVKPDEFRLTQTNPEIRENNTWSAGDIAPNGESTLRIEGIYDLPSSTQKAIEVVATEGGSDEPLSRAFTLTSVTDSPLLIRQTVSGGDDAVETGESLSYSIQVENRGDTTLTNLVVSTQLTGPYNLSSLNTEGGVLAGDTITWTPGGVGALRALRPDESVRIAYSIRASQSVSGRTLTLVSVPSVTSFEIKEPIVGSALSLKMKTQATHTQEVVYDSGAWPMRAGEETRFRINWRVLNSTNPITNARVTANLPLGAASYVSGSAASGTSISFQQGSYSLLWDIGTLQPNAQTSAFFIVAFTPSVADVGQTPNLVNNISFGAVDSFTNEGISSTTPSAKPSESVKP